MSLLRITLIFLFIFIAITTLSSQDYCEFEQKIVSSTGTDVEAFGAENGLSISGDYAIVGTLGDETNGTQSGAAYIFERCGSEWTEIQKIIPDDNQAIDRFGRGVGIWGEYAVVGAPYDDDMGLSSGSVYVYHLIDGEYVFEDKIVAIDGSSSNWFGWTVKIWEDYIIVGAQNGGGNSFEGAAYIFKRNGTEWDFQQKLVASDPEVYSKFGYSLDIKDGLAIVGAFQKNDSLSEAGAAYIYKLEADVWNFKQKLNASDPGEEDHYGYAVSISDDRVIVGSPLKNSSFSDQGVVYFYTSQGDSIWNEIEIIESPEVHIGENFGISIDQDEEKVVVGTTRGFGLSDATGAAYLFSVDTTAWTFEEKLFADDGEHADFFGLSVGIDKNTVICGAQGDDSNGGNAGSGYMFHVACEPMCTKMISPSIGDTMFYSNSSITWAFDSLATGFMFGIGTSAGLDDVFSLQDVGNVYSYYVALDDQEEYFVTIIPYNTFGEAESCSINNFITDFITIQGSLAADVILSCDAEIPSSEISYIDSCDVVTVNLVEEIIPGTCTGNYNIIRTLTVSDDCGTDVVTQEINIVDIDPPVVSDFVDELNVECGDSIPLEEPSATDNCGTVSIDFSDSGSLICGSSVTRTFTVTDDCGNSTEVTQTINISENNNPPNCTNLMAPVGDDVSLDSPLQWLAISGAEGYLLNIGTTVGGNEILDQENVGNVISYFDEDWPLASTVYVTITPYNEFGSAENCGESSFETILVGIDELTSFIRPLTIYPNPTNDGLIRVEVDRNSQLISNGNLKIIDGLGRSIQYEMTVNGGANGGSILSIEVNATPGIYYLRISDDRYVHQGSFLIVE